MNSLSPQCFLLSSPPSDRLLLSFLPCFPCFASERLFFLRVLPLPLAAPVIRTLLSSSLATLSVALLSPSTTPFAQRVRWVGREPVFRRLSLRISFFSSFRPLRANSTQEGSVCLFVRIIAAGGFDRLFLHFFSPDLRAKSTQEGRYLAVAEKGFVASLALALLLRFCKEKKDKYVL